MGMLSFAHPVYLYLLLLLIPVIVWYIVSLSERIPYMTFPGIRRFHQNTVGWKRLFRHVPFVCTLMATAMLIIVLARPQSSNRWKNTSTEGIDIMIDLDISGSMLSRDFHPDRLEAAKQVATEFISGRPDDRIGLVVFSAESFTQCPITTDHAALINLFNNIHSGMLEDGTALGVGLATGVSRLKESEAKSKVIILLTDGVNNTGSIDPLTAAEIARTFGVRVYTIGIGSMGTAMTPVQTPFGIQFQDMPVQIDENVLRQIASTTGGKYFRATDNDKLRAIYKEIDQLEKSRVNVKEYNKKEEEFQGFAVLSLIFLLAGGIVRWTILRSIP